MLQAMNTGHDGSLSTGHGNSPQGMLNRLEAMFLQAADFPIEAIRSQIAEAIDIIIHLMRMPDMSRKVTEISEVQSCADNQILLNPLFKLKMKGEKLALTRTEHALTKNEKLTMKGVCHE